MTEGSAAFSENCAAFGPSENSDGDVIDDSVLEVSDCQWVCDKMLRALESGVASDVTLEVAGCQYHVHKLVLCLASEVFQVMFSGSNYIESRQSVVTLHERDEEALVFPNFIRYLYTGKLSLSCHSALPLLSLADKYDVTSLSQLCCRFMCDRVATACDRHLLIKWLGYSRSSCQHQLAQSCLNFIKWNWHKVASSEQFCRLDEDTLVALLKADDIVVSDEYALYRDVMRWLAALSADNDCSAEVGGDFVGEMGGDFGDEKVGGDFVGEMGGDFGDEKVGGDFGGEVGGVSCEQRVLEHVRFAMLSVSQLTSLVCATGCGRLAPFVMQRVIAAIGWRQGGRDSVSSTDWQQQQQRRPRLYTHERWCSGLTVPRLHQLPPYCTRTLVFQSAGNVWRQPAPKPTAASSAPAPTVEWVVDVYPHGVWFRRCFLIGWQGKVEVPGATLAAMRVTVTPRQLPPPAAGASGGGRLRARVGVLVEGGGGGATPSHVHTLVTRCWVFSDEEPVLNMDGVLQPQQLQSSEGAPSPLLLGEQRDQLCMRFVIVPF